MTTTPWYKRLAQRCKDRPPTRPTANGPKPWWKPINGRDDLDVPYMVRYVVFQSKLCQVFLHEILRSDDTVDFHDHPFGFFHVILEGEYTEERPGDWNEGPLFYATKTKRMTRGMWAFHRASYRHRLQLNPLPFGEVSCKANKYIHPGFVKIDDVSFVSRECPVWSLVITGPTVREWGFWDRVRGCFTPWRQYTEGKERC